MKKHTFKKIALMGLAAGLCTSQGLQAETKSTQSSSDKDSNSSNMGYHLMTEDELLLELNDQGYKTYMSLSPEGKALAREVASMRCNGTNKCKGLNACATDKNSCAGKGSCKGQGKCAISDKNLAVELVAKKMGIKRNQALQSPNQK